MKKYYKTFSEDLLTNNFALSSLVVNTPYKIDGFTTSPKIAKIFTLPFGIRLDSVLLVRSLFQLMASMSILMATTCVLIMCFYLPIESKNIQMLNNAKSLTNEKYSLLVNLQEASSYNKLFSNANTYSLQDTNEIIHLKTASPYNKPSNTLISFNKYPSIQFSGF